MTDESLADPHWRREAKSIAESDARTGKAGVVPHGEVVNEPPRVYRAPMFIQQTGGDARFSSWKEMLEELRIFNELFVGHTCREAEVYLCFTGENLDLTRRLREWVHSYIEHRLATKGYLPDDRRDSFRRFQRFGRELDNILIPVDSMLNSVNYVFLGEALCYGRWLIYTRTWRESLIKGGDGMFLPSSPWQSEMSGILKEYGWESNGIGVFAERILAAVGNDTPLVQGTDTEAGILAEIDVFARDIQEMRPFLAAVHSREEPRIQFANGSVLVWDWVVRHGIGGMCYLSDEKDIHSFAEAGKVNALAIVTFTGILVDNNLPWQAMSELPTAPKLELLGLNRFLLKMCFEKLYSFYEQIDLDAIRDRRRTKLPDEPVTDDEFAVACQDAAVADATIEPVVEQRIGPKLKVRAMKLLRFCKRLSSWFGVEIRQGKGSEIVAHRPGVGSCAIGCHGRDKTVSHVQAKMVLRKLGVSPQAWCESIDRS